MPFPWQVFHWLGREYYREKRIHPTKGSWCWFLLIKSYLWVLINRNYRHPIREKERKKKKKKGQEKEETLGDKTYPKHMLKTCQKTLLSCCREAGSIWTDSALGKSTKFASEYLCLVGELSKICVNSKRSGTVERAKWGKTTKTKGQMRK